MLIKDIKIDSGDYMILLLDNTLSKRYQVSKLRNIGITNWEGVTTAYEPIYVSMFQGGNCNAYSWTKSGKLLKFESLKQQISIELNEKIK